MTRTPSADCVCSCLPRLPQQRTGPHRSLCVDENTVFKPNHVMHDNVHMMQVHDAPFPPYPPPTLQQLTDPHHLLQEHTGACTRVTQHRYSITVTRTGRHANVTGNNRPHHMPVMQSQQPQQNLCARLHAHKYTLCLESVPAALTGPNRLNRVTPNNKKEKRKDYALWGVG